MPWAIQALQPYEGVHTDISETGLIVMSIVIIISLAALLIPVNLAARPPRYPQPGGPVSRARPVEGSTHLGEPRSVAPHRDEPAEPAGSAEAVPRGSGGDEG
ncbi:MAG TPA: hypothetical protein VG268_09790 [Streptosporangiaceae bacterium]|jgi:hypothetical protein|nr:hypothetical protein [Streptosporangiaceae bacterium]